MTPCLRELTTPLIPQFQNFCFFSRKKHSSKVWLRLKETEIVYDALSSGSNDPAYNLELFYLFVEDIR